MQSIECVQCLLFCRCCCLVVHVSSPFSSAYRLRSVDQSSLDGASVSCTSQNLTGFYHYAEEYTATAGIMPASAWLEMCMFRMSGPNCIVLVYSMCLLRYYHVSLGTLCGGQIPLWGAAAGRHGLSKASSTCLPAWTFLSWK